MGQDKIAVLDIENQQSIVGELLKRNIVGIERKQFYNTLKGYVIIID